MTIVFVLVKPAVPENIGAAARAIKTMGFSQLRVVDSTQHLHKQARILAHGAQDVMDGIKTFADLPAALDDIDLVVGTSAKRRLGKRHNYAAPELKQILASKGATVNSIALVFGCEEAGLSNEELACCDLLSSIPIANSYPSLNLSQAVMIFAYSLSGLNLQLGAKDDLPTAASWFVLKKKLAKLFDQLAVTKQDKLYQWGMERIALLTSKDVDFLHRLLGKLEKNNKHNNFD